MLKESNKADALLEISVDLPFKKVYYYFYYILILNCEKSCIILKIFMQKIKARIIIFLKKL